MYFAPLMDSAFLTLFMKSSGYPIEACATYGIRCAAIISTMGFLGVCSQACVFPTGVVVVHAPIGVDDERWMPVFMYASLS